MNRTTRKGRPVTLGEAARSEPRTAPADPEPFAAPDPGRPGFPPPGEIADGWAPPRGRPAAVGEPGGTTDLADPAHPGDPQPADLVEPVEPHPLSRLLVVLAAGLLGADLVAGSGPLPLRLAAVAAAGACGVLLWRSLDTARRRHALLVAELTETEVDADARQVAVAGLFVNLARRNQSLVDRQLSLIGEMEQSEHRPEALGELFQLDHLATRIRRHAESLLVLAGDESPSRSWRRPVLLSEVARAAAAEVEEYRRVDVLVAENVEVAGRAVADLAHLLAELIENATTYSPAERRVQVRSHAEPSGDANRPAIVVAVEDNGIGMADADIDAVNRVLAEPRLLDVRGRTMGVHVVSRLARRYGLTVRLGPTAGGGVTALVTLPADLVTESDPARPALPPASSAGPKFDPLLAAGTSARPAGPPPLPAAPTARPAPAPSPPAPEPSDATRRDPAHRPAPPPSSSDATWSDPARHPAVPPSDAGRAGILGAPIALPGPGPEHPGDAPAPGAPGAYGDLGSRRPTGRETFVAPGPDGTRSGAPGSSARSAGRETFTPDAARRGTFTPGPLGPATPVGGSGAFDDPVPARTDLFPPPVAAPADDDEVISLPPPGDIGPASGPPTSTKDREHVRSMLSRFQASQRAGRALADAPPGSLAPASPTAATATPHPVPQEDS